MNIIIQCVKDFGSPMDQRIRKMQSGISNSNKTDKKKTITIHDSSKKFKEFSREVVTLRLSI